MSLAGLRPGLRAGDGLAGAHGEPDQEDELPCGGRIVGPMERSFPRGPARCGVRCRLLPHPGRDAILQPERPAPGAGPRSEGCRRVRRGSRAHRESARLLCGDARLGPGRAPADRGLAPVGVGDQPSASARADTADAAAISAGRSAYRRPGGDVVPTADRAWDRSATLRSLPDRSADAEDAYRAARSPRP